MYNDSVSSEQSVLGGLLSLSDMNLDSAQKVMSIVKSTSFAGRAHQVIYQAIVNLSRSGQMVDIISLDHYLAKQGEIDNIGGIAYLAELHKNSIVANIISHAEIVRESAIKRMANSHLNNALAAFNDSDGRSVYEKLGELESTIQAILNRGIQNKDVGLVHASEVCERWTDDLQDRFDNPTVQQGYTTGMAGLDEILAPKNVRKGSLVVVGARPKMGKTAFLGSMVKQFALEHKKAVALFSLEMPNDQIMERMLCERGNVNANVFYDRRASDEDFAKISGAIGDYVNSKLYMDDTPSITIDHIQRECRKLAKKEEMGLIAVDYLTLMETGKADRNDLAYGAITKALKALAKELNCVVLLLTQLNRALESRPNKRPMPSDSRDTGQIEQDCDLWIGLYREAVYNDNVPENEKGITEVIVRLNRHGETGTAYLNLKNGYFVEGWKPTEMKTTKSKYSDDDY